MEAQNDLKLFAVVRGHLKAFAKALAKCRFGRQVDHLGRRADVDADRLVQARHGRRLRGPRSHQAQLQLCQEHVGAKNIVADRGASLQKITGVAQDQARLTDRFLGDTASGAGLENSKV